MPGAGSEGKRVVGSLGMVQREFSIFDGQRSPVSSPGRHVALPSACSSVLSVCAENRGLRHGGSGVQKGRQEREREAEAGGREQETSLGGGKCKVQVREKENALSFHYLFLECTEMELDLILSCMSMNAKPNEWSKIL